MMRPLALCALALVLALLVAGCGGGSSTTSTSTSTSTTAGGESSIENFGSKAGGSDQAAILAAFHGYLTAIAAHDDARACAFLSSSVQRSLEQIVVKRLEAKGCPAILPKLLSSSAAPLSRQQASGKITRVRVQGDRAFVVYHAPGARLYAMTMVRENGAWKTATVAADVLVPSPAVIGAAP